MVGVAKKLMDKAGKEGKPWISGLFDYRVTPQSSSIASPLQLMTQHTPREKNLPQLPSVLGAPEMHLTHQELIKRQGSSSKLVPRITSRYTSLGTTQAKCYMGTSNSCELFILDHAGKWCRTAQSVYRCTRSMLKIRSTPTDGEQKAKMREWSTETENLSLAFHLFPMGTETVQLRILKDILHPIVCSCHCPH